MKVGAALVAAVTALAFFGIVRAASISDLTVGSATVAPGETVTINITATSDDLGAYRVDVQYDSTLVSADACTSNFGTCSIGLIASDTIRINGVSGPGITGTNVVLSTIIFLAGSNGGTADLTVNPATLVLSDTTGDILLTVTPTNGSITIDASAPTPTRAPAPTPRPATDFPGALPVGGGPDSSDAQPRGRANEAAALAVALAAAAGVSLHRYRRRAG